MNRNVIIMGASGHGKVIADIVKASGDSVLGFLDDDTKKDTLGVIADFNKFPTAEFVIGIGNIRAREKISKLDCRWYTAIHPSAIISPSAKIGVGTVVMPNAVINAEACIGNHCIINSTAVIEHNCFIDDYTHVSVGSKLGGTVKIGKRALIGIGSSIVNNVSICENVTIGAGAVVVKNIERAGIYTGIPARMKY